MKKSSEIAIDRGRRQGHALRELMIAHQLISTRLGQALRPLGISLTHTSFLSHLAGVGGTAAVSEIATAMEVNQPAVSKTMKTLSDLGAIEVRFDETDGRRRTAKLTEAGYVLVARAQEAMDPAATLTFESLTDRRLEQLTELLTKIRIELDRAR